MISALLRFVGAATLILCYLLECTIKILVQRDSKKRKRKQIECISKYARRILSVIGIQSSHEGVPLTAGSLMIGNHLSYLDILAIASSQPAVFITSIETKMTPVLGLICKLGGCIFVERRRHFVSRTELAEVSKALQQGFNVVLFPEATTSDGSGVLPFKRALLKSAQQVGAKIHPICLNYFRDGENARPDLVPYFGPMTFLPHFLKVMTAGKLKAEVRVLSELTVVATSNLKTDIAYARARITSEFVPIAVNEPRTERAFQGFNGDHCSIFEYGSRKGSFAVGGMTETTFF